jgi:PRC-barrel domain/Domain of unknown function (DUF2382)
MPTLSIETVRGWLGRVMIDRDGNRIGEITDIYLDNETDRPEWAVVRTGLFGLRSTFVPLAKAIETGEQVQVPHQRTQVKDAPNIEPDGQLSQAEEAGLYRHYGLDYDAVTTEGDTAAGETPSGPAGQVAGPGTDERTGTAPAGADQDTKTEVDHPAGTTGSSRLADTPSQGPTDVGTYGPSGTRTRQGEDAGRYREPDVGVAGEPARRQTQDVELPGTDVTGIPRSTAQDPFPVGEGVSRPFVYETPGQPEGGVGTRRRPPGQVRLRRYLVTEVVTETESGQRHEVQVEQEPISDDEVDAVTATPGQTGQPVPGERTGPDDNDWFRPEDDPRH